MRHCVQLWHGEDGSISGMSLKFIISQAFASWVPSQGNAAGLFISKHLFFVPMKTHPTGFELAMMPPLNWKSSRYSFWTSWPEGSKTSGHPLIFLQHEFAIWVSSHSSSMNLGSGTFPIILPLFLKGTVWLLSACYWHTFSRLAHWTNISLLCDMNFLACCDRVLAVVSNTSSK